MATRTRITRIKHGSIKQGDSIRVEGKYGDMDIRREGRVARVTDMGNSWDYTTAAGFVLLSVHRDGNTNPAYATIDLLARNLDTPLFDWR